MRLMVNEQILQERANRTRVRRHEHRTRERISRTRRATTDTEIWPVKIISGGQTGADRAALDFALEHGLECGGSVPRGRLAEDGRIPDRYPGLVETDTADPAERTGQNVREADATLIVSHGPLHGGSQLTLEKARGRGKPVLHLDVQALGISVATERLREWLEIERPRVLNVAGPRASDDAEIYDAVATLLHLAGDALGPS